MHSPVLGLVNPFAQALGELLSLVSQGAKLLEDWQRGEDGHLPYKTLSWPILEQLAVFLASQDRTNHALGLSFCEGLGLDPVEVFRALLCTRLSIELTTGRHEPYPDAWEDSKKAKFYLRPLYRDYYMLEVLAPECEGMVFLALVTLQEAESNHTNHLEAGHLMKNKLIHFGNLGVYQRFWGKRLNPKQALYLSYEDWLNKPKFSSARTAICNYDFALRHWAKYPYLFKVDKFNSGYFLYTYLFNEDFWNRVSWFYCMEIDRICDSLSPAKAALLPILLDATHKLEPRKRKDWTFSTSQAKTWDFFFSRGLEKVLSNWNEIEYLKFDFNTYPYQHVPLLKKPSYLVSIPSQNLKTLSLSFWTCGGSLFHFGGGCPKLSVLNLSNCIFDQAFRAWLPWSQIKHLSLTAGDLEGEDLLDFLSNLPLLNSLSLSSDWLEAWLKNWNKWPNLAKLELIG